MKDILYVKRKRIIEWLMFMGLAMLYWGTDFRLEFNLDTYYSVTVGWNDRAWDMLARNGRFFAALIYKIIAVFHLSDGTGYRLSFFLGLIFLAFALNVSYRFLSDYMDKIWAFVVSMILIMNPNFIDFFFTYEACQFLLGVLTAVIGTVWFVKYLKEGQRKNLIITFVCVLCSVFCYQSVGGLFIMFSMPFIIKHGDGKIGIFIKSNLWMALIYGVSNVLNLAMLYLLGSVKLQEETDWVLKAQAAKVALKIAWADNFYFFSLAPRKQIPMYILYGIILLCLILVVYRIVRIAMSETKPLKPIGITALSNLGGVIYIMCVAMSLQYALIMIGYGRPRICYPIGALLGTVVLHLFINIASQGMFSVALYETNTGLKKFSVRWIFVMLLLTAGFIYISAEYFEFQNAIINKYTTNARDRYTCQIIGQMIEEYEEETGNVVESVCFYKDANIEAGYDDVTYVQDIMIKSFWAHYSNLTSLNYYLGTDYVKCEENSEYKEYFESNDWTMFSTEQIIFEGTELHICMY